MNIGIVAETQDKERRVALTPDGVETLKSKGFAVTVQESAGARAGFPDAAYREAGAEVVPTASDVIRAADLLVTLNPPAEVEGLKILVGFLNPALVETLKEKQIAAFALERIPRITRAQSMDVLSSFATIAGYKAALLAADRLPKFFPMFMSAAGTIPAARALILGAGVAGLQAIATCRRLGAIVEAFDVRPAVKEQVESLGAKFVEAPELTAEGEGGYAKEVTQDQHEKELALIAGRLPKCDVVISTAQIPGRKAPILLTREMVKLMKPGSVVVDLAAATGGNCEATVPGQTTVYEGVTVCGPLHLLSEMASDASRMVGKNIVDFLLNLAPEGEIRLNMDDEIIRDTLVSPGALVPMEVAP